MTNRNTNKEKRKFTLKYFNGITKSAELLRMEGLTSTEKDVYAFYENITNHWGMGKCIVPTWEVAYWLGFDEQKVKRAKRKLKEMGLIETGLDRRKGFAHGVGVKTNPMGQNLPIANNTPYGSEMTYSTYGSNLTYSEEEPYGSEMTYSNGEPTTSTNEEKDQNDTHYGSPVTYSTYGSKMNHKNLNQLKGLNSFNDQLPNVHAGKEQLLNNSNWVLEEPEVEEKDVKDSILYLNVHGKEPYINLEHNPERLLREVVSKFLSIGGNNPQPYDSEYNTDLCMLYYIQQANVTKEYKLEMASLCWRVREAQ